MVKKIAMMQQCSTE